MIFFKSSVNKDSFEDFFAKSKLKNKFCNFNFNEECVEFQLDVYNKLSKLCIFMFCFKELFMVFLKGQCYKKSGSTWVSTDLSVIINYESHMDLTISKPFI